MLELAPAAAILASLTLYVLSGGADFGAGVWDLLAAGPRGPRQRRLIAEAIAPIWEVNHIWLIVAIVILFTAYPTAFAAASTALHVPLMIALLGIVLRGSSFAFRAFSRPAEPSYRLWSRLFAASSAVTPVALGACLAAVSGGRLRVRDGIVETDFVSAWWAPFPLAAGALALALFALLAACYLAVEAREADLREDFRRRALAALAACAAAAGAAFALKPDVHFTWLGGGAAASAALLAALLARRPLLARAAAAGMATAVLWGWAWAQYPYLIIPDITIAGAAAPRSVLRPLMLALAAGGAVLAPALFYLFRVFKKV